MEKETLTYKDLGNILTEKLSEITTGQKESQKKETKKTETKSETITEKDLLSGFEKLLEKLKNFQDYKKNKVENDSEIIGHAVKIYLFFGNITPLKVLLVKNNTFKTFKDYLEKIGLVFEYKVKTDTLKVLRVAESFSAGFGKPIGKYDSEKAETIPTFKDYLKDLKDEKDKERKEKGVDYQDRLSKLFKDIDKKKIAEILSEYLKNNLK